MKRSGLFLALIFVGTSVAQQVKHAPIDNQTQCRADQKLWLETLDKNKDAVNFQELWGWHHEMTICAITWDPQFQGDYLNVVALTDAVREDRLESFVRRHGLYEQFITEDMQGKRGR